MLDAALFDHHPTHVFHLHVVQMLSVNWIMETQFALAHEERLEILS